MDTSIILIGAMVSTMEATYGIVWFSKEVDIAEFCRIDNLIPFGVVLVVQEATTQLELPKMLREANSFVTIVGTNILLSAENYQWQWTSFFSLAAMVVFVSQCISGAFTLLGVGCHLISNLEDKVHFNGGGIVTSMNGRNDPNDRMKHGIKKEEEFQMGACTLQYQLPL